MSKARHRGIIKAACEAVPSLLQKGEIDAEGALSVFLQCAVSGSEILPEKPGADVLRRVMARLAVDWGTGEVDRETLAATLSVLAYALSTTEGVITEDVLARSEEDLRAYSDSAATN